MHEKDIIFDSINRLDEWITKNDWKGYDPFDGLNAKLLYPLTFNNYYFKIVLQQFVRRFPVNLRPFIGVKKETSGIGMGFCAAGYLKLYEATQKKEYLEKMKLCLDWSIKHSIKGSYGYSWGNHFNYVSRGGSMPLGIPTIVWTSLMANIFLDAYEATDETKYFEIAKSSCDFIVNDIGRYQDSEDSFCFMYTPVNKDNPVFRRCIHNSNVLGASLLARIYRHTKNEELFSLAKKSITFTLKCQLPEAAWYYGEPKKYRWIDNFHTGYVLESIHTYIKATGDDSNEDKLRKGYKYFISTFFQNDGTPRYYNYKTYPIDIQCSSQGIQTLVNLQEYDQDSIEVAKKIAHWTIKHMQNSEGYFYFRKYPFVTNKTPMFHWGQATMLAALATLAKQLYSPVPDQIKPKTYHHQNPQKFKIASPLEIRS